MRWYDAVAMQVVPQPQSQRGYSESELAEIVGVPLAQVQGWIKHGLLTASADGFAFQDLTRAQTLRDLAASGLTLKKMRAELKKLGAATPTTQRPAAVVCDNGQILGRLDGGELMRTDGQFQIDYADGDAAPIAIDNPRNATDLYARGIEQESNNDLPAAIQCYRDSLIAGGPNAEICFALAHALAAAGEHAQAAERYRQVVELDPRQPDAWNNLGVALCALNRLDEACDAFRRALQIRPRDPGSRYNLADALDEIGNAASAREHWQEYLKMDRQSERAAYARRRLSAS